MSTIEEKLSPEERFALSFMRDLHKKLEKEEDPKCTLVDHIEFDRMGFIGKLFARGYAAGHTDGAIAGYDIARKESYVKNKRSLPALEVLLIAYYIVLALVILGGFAAQHHGHELYYGGSR